MGWLNKRKITPEVKRSNLISRIERQHRLVQKLDKLLPFIKYILFIVSICWFAAIPFPQLSKKTFVSENAIQAAQAKTYWDWEDVKVADMYAEQIAQYANESSLERAQFIKDSFAKLGLKSYTQSYEYLQIEHSGTNTYAILQAPKTDGAETLVLSASWLSRSDEHEINIRGVSSILAIASQFRKLNFWSKDIVFLIGDGYLDGIQAFITTYHNDKTKEKIFKAQELVNQPGPIWAALNIDYPHHSFSHIGLYHETSNGALPNFDFISATTHITRHTSRLSLRLHDRASELSNYQHVARKLDWSLPSSSYIKREILTKLMIWIDKHPKIKMYLRNFMTLFNHFKLASLGRPGGPEGIYGQYGIDAIGLYGVPSEGPHGFHAMGITIESVFRSLNNLLERFHASTFFYLLPTPGFFIPLAHYLPSVLCMSAFMTVGGLDSWIKAVPTMSKTVNALFPIVVGFFVRVLVYWFMPVKMYESMFELFIMGGGFVQLMAMDYCTFGEEKDAVSVKKIIEAFCKFLIGLIIAILSVLNFPTGVLFSLIFGFGLLISSLFRLKEIGSWLIHPIIVSYLICVLLSFSSCSSSTSTLSSFITLNKSELLSRLITLRSIIGESLVANTWFIPLFSLILDPIWVTLFIFVKL